MLWLQYRDAGMDPPVLWIQYRDVGMDPPVLCIQYSDVDPSARWFQYHDMRIKEHKPRTVLRTRDAAVNKDPRRLFLVSDITTLK